jgi:hypothetical protein
MKNKLELFVPVSGTTTEKVIDRGSAIVAKPNSNIFYYEGNRHNAENLVTYEQRVSCAAGRLATKYPTIAFGQFNPAELQSVGLFDQSAGWVLSIHDFERLHDWVDPTETLSLTETNHAVFKDFHLIHGFNKIVEEITGFEGYATTYPSRRAPLTTAQRTSLLAYFDCIEEPIAHARMVLYLSLLEKTNTKAENV